MTRRRNGWDYCAPGAYMITLTLADRSRPWLGEVMTREQAREHHGGLAAGEQGDSRALCRQGAGAAMVVLSNKGFSPLFKPEGSLFDRCAEGRLLMLAPAAWPYTPGERAMTRGDACALNRIAQAIARDGAAEINYKGLTPSFIDDSARRACLIKNLKG